MALESLTNNEVFKVVASIITGGAFVGWYREKRRGRKDAYGFAIDMIGKLSERVDLLVNEVAELKAQNTIATEAMRMLKDENVELKTKVSELESENTRLKTALGEHGRNAA